MSKKSLFRIALLIFCCWLPFFLAFYPGLGMVDEIYAMQDPWKTSFQPIVYNLFLSFFYNIGIFFFNDFFIGTALATLFLMAVMALAIACVLLWLRGKGVDKKIVFLYGLYYTFFPIIIDYALALVKDKLFAVVLMLLVPVTYELQKENFRDCSWKKLRALMLLSLLLMWTRNNGAYIFIAFCVCILWVMRGSRKQFLQIAVPILLIGMLPSFYAGKNFTEGIGIPLQQIARVVALERPLDEQEKIFIGQMLPLEKMKKSYDSWNADRIKWHEDFQRDFTDTHKREFFATWWSIAKKYPGDYLRAWLLNTQGFWSTASVNVYGPWQSKFGKAYDREMFLAKEKSTLDNGFQVSTFLTMPESWKNLLGAYVWKYSNFPSGGICLWFTVLFGILMCLRGQRHLLLVLAPALFCSLTLILASPIAHALRYVFYYVLCLPLFLVLSRIDLLDNNNLRK